MPSRLDELVHDVQNMTDDELLAQVREIRGDRRISKVATKPASKRKSANKVDKLAKILAAMSPEERKQILERRRSSS